MFAGLSGYNNHINHQQLLKVSSITFILP